MSFPEDSAIATCSSISNAKFVMELYSGKRMRGRVGSVWTYQVTWFQSGWIDSLKAQVKLWRKDGRSFKFCWNPWACWVHPFQVCSINLKSLRVPLFYVWEHSSHNDTMMRGGGGDQTRLSYLSITVSKYLIILVREGRKFSFSVALRTKLELVGRCWELAEFIPHHKASYFNKTVWSCCALLITKGFQ